MISSSIKNHILGYIFHVKWNIIYCVISIFLNFYQILTLF